MAGLSTGARGLWGGNPGLLFTTGLSTGTGLLANLVPSWVLPGAVLDLDFANSLGFNSAQPNKTTPDSILTYTSPSPKLVYGSDGVLRYAPHNLLTYSQEFDNPAWTKTGVTVSANAIAASNGTLTADRLVEDTGTSGHVAVSASYIFTAAPHTVSVEVKAAGRNFALVSMRATEHAVSINLTTGATAVATGSPTGITATDKGNGWWKLEFTATTSSGSAAVNVYASADGVWANRSYLGDGTSGIYAWGAQLNLGSSALTYIPTTTAAVYSLPIDHNPTTFASLGVLIEEQRTNLLTYSQQFNNAIWNSFAAVTVNTAAITAPDGTLTGNLVADNATANNNYGKTQISVTILASTAYTFSIYLKKKDYRYAQINLVTNSTNHLAYFDMDTGAITGASGVTSSSMTNVGNGWWRCVLTASSAVGEVVGKPSVIYTDTTATSAHTGVVGTGTYYWGAQLEAGAFATSYIPTVASQVTRAADNVSILTSAFGYNAAAGTMVATYRDVGQNAGVWRIDDNSENSYFRLIRDTGSIVFDIVRAAGLEAQFYRTPATEIKHAAAWTANSANVALNGSLATEDTTVTVPTGMLTFRIGQNRNSVWYNGPIKRLTYFPTRLTNADLQRLTT